MPKLLIATPAYDPLIWIKTYQAMLSMDMCGLDVECFTPTGFTVVEARNKSAQEARERKADWLLFVDSDMVPPKDALRNLLSHDVDVCMGYYSKGGNTEGRTCLYESDRDSYDALVLKSELHDQRDEGYEIMQVRGGGMGFALIRTSVFGRIGEPWFDYVWSRTGRKLSEDYYFCTKCRNAGIRLYADTRVDCGHVKEVVT
jgi:glycosyltransferase involved in cell wall biosynthesis